MDMVRIFDTTLRDGEQSPGISLDVGEKLEIAEQLGRLTVDVIEAGFPIASQGDFEAVEAISKAVQGSTIAALSRTAFKDVDRAWEAVRHAAKPRIHIFIATSPNPVRARPAMVELLTDLAIASTASKSPWLAIGNPASITSTPRRANCSAISSFSPTSREIPGDCSPSRSVVSKIFT